MLFIVTFIEELIAYTALTGDELIAVTLGTVFTPAKGELVYIIYLDFYRIHCNGGLETKGCILKKYPFRLVSILFETSKEASPEWLFFKKRDEQNFSFKNLSVVKREEMEKSGKLVALKLELSLRAVGTFSLC